MTDPRAPPAASRRTSARWARSTTWRVIVARPRRVARLLARHARPAASSSVLPIEHDRVTIAFLPVGESKVELVQPTDDTTGVARFLESKGEGFHHVCFEVDEPVGDAAPGSGSTASS